MSAWLWLALAVFLFAAFLCIRLRCSVSYDAEGCSALACFGRIPVFRYPRKAGKTEKPQKRKPDKPKAEEAMKEEPDKGGGLPELRNLLSIICDILGKLRRKLRIDELTLRYCSAAEDPFKAAMAFGGASAVIGTLTAPLERAFRIIKRDIRTAVSFTETEPTVVLRFSLSLSLFSLLSILLYAGLRYFKEKRKTQKQIAHPMDGYRYNNTEG